MFKKFLYSLLFSMLTLNLAYGQDTPVEETQVEQSYKPQVLYIGSFSSFTPYNTEAKNRIPGMLSTALTEEGFEHEFIDITQPHFQLGKHVADHIFKMYGLGYGGTNTTTDWSFSSIEQEFLDKAKSGEIDPDWIFIEGGYTDLAEGHFNSSRIQMMFNNIPDKKGKPVNIVFIGIAPPESVRTASLNALEIFNGNWAIPGMFKTDMETAKNSLNKIDAYFESLKTKYFYSSETSIPIEERRVIFVPNALEGLVFPYLSNETLEEETKKDCQLVSEDVLDLIAKNDFDEGEYKKYQRNKTKKLALQVQDELKKAPFVLTAEPSPDASPDEQSGVEKAVTNIMNSLIEQRFFEVAEHYIQINQED